MTEAELLEKIRDIIANDEEITQWCQSNFNKRHTVYLGIDEEEQAKQVEYPVVAIVAIHPDRQSGKNTMSWQVDIGCGVVSKPVVETENTKTYPGFIQVAALSGLVETALRNARFCKIRYVGSVDQSTFMPVFVNHITFVFETVNIKQL